MSRARDLSKIANSQAFSIDASNNVGIGSSTPDAKLDVVGVVSATEYYGDGSNLTGIVAGATLSNSSGTQRVVVTGQTSGSMTAAATDSDLTYDASTNTLSATQFSGTLLGNATGLQGTPNLNVGVVTATSFSGDGSNLTGGGSGSANFVATGSISNGDTVVVNSNGTVSVLNQTSNTISVGQTLTVSNAAFSNNGSAYDPINKKVIIAYSDAANSNNGRVIVGVINGSNIIFGDPVTFSTNSVSDVRAAYDSSSGRVAICYYDNSASLQGKAIVGLVDGLSMTFGSEVIFNSVNTGYISITSTGTNKVVIVFGDSGNSWLGSAIVGTISGNSISFGSKTTIDFTATSADTTICYDPDNDKVIVAYRDTNNSNYGTANVGTISGTNITFGANNVFNSAATYKPSIVYDTTNNKVVITYMDGGATNAYAGGIVSADVSGTNLTFGIVNYFSTNPVDHLSASYDSVSDKIVVCYMDDNNNYYGTAHVCGVSGTSITVGTSTVFQSASSSAHTSTFDPVSDRVVVAAYDTTSTGFVAILDPTNVTSNLTAENYIGIAAETIADGQTGKINVVSGINTSQTGLTTGRTYYVQTDGSLSTSADNPSVVAGTSISSTEILVR